MRRLLTAAEAKAIDRYTIDEIGIPGVVLMERAALAVAEQCEQMMTADGELLCVCGTGNNGADGVAVARILSLRGYQTKLLIVGDEDRGTEEFKLQLHAVRRLRIPVCKAGEPAEYIKRGECSLIVDALFGVGLTRGIEGIYANVIDQINRSGVPVIAVDLPSGISADDGKVLGCAVKADRTVTFGSEKIGMILYPGTEYCGERMVAEIGLAEKNYFEEQNESATVFTYDEDDLKRLPKRPAYSNKGTFGRVLVIAGSPNMGGAALFAGTAAYRMGAGLVEIATVKENRALLQTELPEAVLTVYDPLTDPTDWLIPAMRRAKAIVVGPGLGMKGNGAGILALLLEQAVVPVVIDADGLNLIAGDERLKDRLKGNCQVILTPHLGEMSRLTGKTVGEIQLELIETARAYSQKMGVICAMKDARIVVASPDGNVYINTSGNAGMATGGSGDLLAGMIGALLAEGMEPYESACLGVYLHGRYGDMAKERYGARTMIASDLAKIIRETE